MVPLAYLVLQVFQGDLAALAPVAEQDLLVPEGLAVSQVSLVNKGCQAPQVLLDALALLELLEQVALLEYQDLREALEYLAVLVLLGQ